MSISYEGIGEWCATFVCGVVSEGDIVKVSANGTVGKCTAGDGFCGVVRAVAHDGKACTVQLAQLCRQCAETFGVDYGGNVSVR